MPVEEDDSKKPKRYACYDGPEEHCAICGHKFVPGDMVSHDTASGKILCSSVDNDEPRVKKKYCVPKWRARRKPEVIAITEKVFCDRDSLVETEEVRKYFGTKAICDWCSKRLVLGAQVAAIPSAEPDDEPMLFCLPQLPKLQLDPDGCPAQWAEGHGKKHVVIVVMEFWGDSALKF